MQYIYLLIAVLIIFILGVLTSKLYYDTERLDFLEFQQYDPQYIAYEHDEMLKVCEDYNLEYSFEDGTCIQSKDK